VLTVLRHARSAAVAGAYARREAAAAADAVRASNGARAVIVGAGRAVVTMVARNSDGGVCREQSATARASDAKPGHGAGTCGGHNAAASAGPGAGAADDAAAAAFAAAVAPGAGSSNAIADDADAAAAARAGANAVAKDSCGALEEDDDEMGSGGGKDMWPPAIAPLQIGWKTS